jgi:hypothetical protein
VTENLRYNGDCARCHRYFDDMVARLMFVTARDRAEYLTPLGPYDRLVSATAVYHADNHGEGPRCAQVR